MTGYSIVMTEMLLLLFRLLRVFLLSLEFSLAKAVLTLVFSVSTFLLKGTKTIVLAKAILKEEKSYPKPI